MTEHPDSNQPLDGPDEVDDVEADSLDEIDLRPLTESTFAVAHGFVRTSPDVAVSGPAVHRARTAAGLTAEDVAEEMARHGTPFDAEDITRVEERVAARMPPRQARLLAAILDKPVASIEATAEPWPARPSELRPLQEAGVDTVVVGHEVVVDDGAGNRLGVVRCQGDATVLDSRTYRLAAATLLNGAWSHLAGVLLVSEQAPHRGLVVDVGDCVTRSHAPSGLSGFSRLTEPEPLPDALASHAREYSISWSDPEPLDAGAASQPATSRRLVARQVDLADQLAAEARRARQPGKRDGYGLAADWLRSLEPDGLADLFDDLASVTPETAREHFDEALAEHEPREAHDPEVSS